MKNRNLSVLFSCVFLGSILISFNSLGSVNQQLVKQKAGALAKAPADYSQRQKTIRSSILKMFPGTYLDSMGIVVNLLSDSVRNDLSKSKINDSIEYFKTCLNNVLKDSILLNKLGRLSLDKNEETPNYTNILIAHCKDESNSFVVDSVTMDVFSGSHLIVSAIADSFGILQVHNIPKGTYDIIFSRKLYSPVSLKHFKFADEGPMYINILLRKKSSSFIQLMSENTWLFITIGAAVFLVLLFIFGYFLARFMSRRNLTS